MRHTDRQLDLHERCWGRIRAAAAIIACCIASTSQPAWAAWPVTLYQADASASMRLIDGGAAKLSGSDSTTSVSDPEVSVVVHAHSGVGATTSYTGTSESSLIFDGTSLSILAHLRLDYRERADLVGAAGEGQLSMALEFEVPGITQWTYSLSTVTDQAFPGSVHVVIENLTQGITFADVTTGTSAKLDFLQANLADTIRITYTAQASGTAAAGEGNAVFDAKLLAVFETEDCNANDNPDDRDIADGISPDCNGNGVPDECDVPDGNSPDCNFNLIPDECEVPLVCDCNRNGIDDLVDIANGSLTDCDADGAADECREFIDCNDNGIHDPIDLANGTSSDVIGQGGLPDCIPDECQIACSEPGAVGTIYWTTHSGSGVRRWDCPVEVDLIVGLPDAGTTRSIAIDSSAGKMYLTENASRVDDGIPRESKIHRANLDGSGLETLLVTCCIPGQGGPTDIQLDPGRGKMYWLEPSAAFDPIERIYRANLDGTGLEILVDGLSRGLGLVVDPVERRIYWAVWDTDANDATISSASLDGTHIREIAVFDAYLFDLALDGQNRKLYWILRDPNDNPGVPDFFRIQRGNLDGSNIEELVSGQRAANLAIDSLNEKMYWSVYPQGNIMQANLDGSGVEEVHVTDPFRIWDIALDLGPPDCNDNGIPDDQDINNGTSEDCNDSGVPDECEPDCNLNGVADECDISSGTSEDCNSNFVPDECEADQDCNTNGTTDICDIGAGTSADCNGNDIPDECESSDDCNGNGVADICELADLSLDCNLNGVPDDCDIASMTSTDCDGSGRPDECEMHSDCDGDGTVDICDLALGLDCNGNNIPDQCEVDCNSNGIPDECDIDDGSSDDCDTSGNGIPDECEPDCNGNGVADSCDIRNGTSSDCNGNGVLDECELTDGTSTDINFNGVPDECEDCNQNGFPDDYDVATGIVEDCDQNGRPDDCDTDCNLNGIPDSCDLASGTSLDVDADGVPDECGKIYYTTSNRADEPCDPHDGCGCQILGVNRLQQINPDGSNWEEIGPPGGKTIRPTVDFTGQTAYWTKNYKLNQMDLETGEVTILIDGDFGIGGPRGVVAVDAIRGKIYWVQEDPNALYLGEIFRKIQRANLDGSNVEDVLANGSAPKDVYIDALAGKLYWAERIRGWIENANLDGSDITPIHISTDSVSSYLALDICEEQVYFLDSREHFVRIKFDGTGYETLFFAEDVEHFAMDVGNRSLYWVKTCNPGIFSVNVDDPLFAKKTAVITGGNFLGGDIRGIAVDSIGADCNASGILDRCEVRRGYSDDCNSNDVPDVCEPDEDCNSNGRRDICDIGLGISEDCSRDSIPDECQTFEDCNDNGEPDICEALEGTTVDCNFNLVPDECELASDSGLDLNLNGVLDECELLVDCNSNMVIDSIDIALGTTADCNLNAVPDVCDIADEFSIDCEDNGIPDECEPFVDCDGNGQRDVCEIVAKSSLDCNLNLVPDACDLTNGTSVDFDGDGMPDECCVPTAVLAAETIPGPPDGRNVPSVKLRTLSFAVANIGTSSAVRVRPVNLAFPFDVFNGSDFWVGEPFEVSENSGAVDPSDAPGVSTFMAARLQCEPVCFDFASIGTVHVSGEVVIPSGEYEIQAIDCDACALDLDTNYSPPLVLQTSLWGDLVKDCTADPCGPPDNSVDVVTDVSAVLTKFANLNVGVSKSRCDVEPSTVDFLINISDVTFILNAFMGAPYPFAPSEPPPCSGQ